jgi:hypothetical protein
MPLTRLTIKSWQRFASLYFLCSTLRFKAFLEVKKMCVGGFSTSNFRVLSGFVAKKNKKTPQKKT